MKWGPERGENREGNANRRGAAASDLALPHYDTRDVSAITDLPYMVVSHDLGQCAIALSHLGVLEPLTS